MQILQDIIEQRLMNFQLTAICVPKLSHHSNDIIYSQYIAYRSE